MAKNGVQLAGVMPIARDLFRIIRENKFSRPYAHKSRGVSGEPRLFCKTFIVDGISRPLRFLLRKTRGHCWRNGRVFCLRSSFENFVLTSLLRQNPRDFGERIFF